MSHHGLSEAEIQSLLQPLTCAANTPADIVAVLAESTIAAADLASLRVGDILMTEQNAAEPLVIKVDGQPKFYGQPATFDGHTVVEVIGPIADDEPLT